MFGLVSVTSGKFEEFAFSGIIIVKKNRTKTDIPMPNDLHALDTGGLSDDALGPIHI